jgi:Coiled-coil domain-containing protein 56
MPTQQPQQQQPVRRLLSDAPGRPEFPEDVAIIDRTVHMKNAALGVALTAFVFGVANYSMYAVGQASRADDPLAALQQEAAAARAAQSKEMTETEDAAAMLAKFQKGEYDPDAAEQQAILEALEADAAKRNPWWKFW